MKKIMPYAIMLILVFVLFAGFIFSDKMLFGTDFVDTGYYGVKYYRDYILQNHSFPMWDPHIHGGFPFIDAMHGAIFFPFAVPMRLAFPPHRSFGLTQVLYVLLAGWFMYILLRHYGLRRDSSLLGGIAYMFSPLLISLTYAGHDAKMSVGAMLPLIIWLLERAMQKRKLVDFTIFGMAYSLLVLSAHPQMAYFASWLIAALFVFRLVRGFVKKRFTIAKSAVLLALFVMAIALGVGISIIQLYPPFYYVGHYSVRTVQTEERGIEFCNSWRLNIEDLVATTYPDFTGLDLESRRSYWGRNIFRINSMYVGMLIVMLALVGLLALKKPLLYFLGGFSLFAITYSMGTQTPLFYLYYYLIPGVKKFRGPEMLFFTAVFAAVVAMTFTIDAVFRNNVQSQNQDSHKSKGGRKSKSRDLKKFSATAKWLLWIAMAFTAVLILLSVAGKPICTWWLKTAPNVQGVNIQAKLGALSRNFPIFLRSSWLALVLAWLSIGLLLWRLKSSRLASAAITAVIAIVLLADLWRIGAPFIKTEDANKHFQKPPVVDYLKKRQSSRGLFRTLCLPNTMNNTHLASFGLDAITFTELYGNQLRWYDEFTGRHEQPQNIQKYFHFWDILNIDYLVSPQAVNLENLLYVENFGGWFLYRNISSFPRARSFHRWETASHDAALARLKNPAFSMDSLINYRNTLIVEDAPAISMPMPPDSGEAPYTAGRIVDNMDDDFYVDIDMQRDGMLFLSQNWYPDWHAEENDKEIPIIRADYAFIAVPLEKGKHKVHFYYDSPRVNKSFVASAAFIVLSVLLLIIGLILGRKEND